MNHTRVQDTVDPVCGMTVNPKSAPAETTYQGRTYYFCAPVCKERFDEQPEKHLAHQAHQAHQPHQKH